MHPGRVRSALGRPSRTARAVAVALAGGLVGGVLLAGCATRAEDGNARDDGTSPPGTTRATTDPAPTTTEQTQDTDMTQQPDTTGPTGPSDSDGPPATTVEPTGTAAGTLTEQDSGARVTLAVGEERPLQLGSAWSWSEPVVDGTAVTLTPVEFLVDPGYVEWLVTGTAEGPATVDVVGEPVCGDTTVCPPTTVTLDVEVTG